jgi:diguanylate cyclase
VAGFSGFMLFFVYLPEAVNWTVGVIVIMIIAILVFIPIRFSLAVLCCLYGVTITLLTRWVMGSNYMTGLFFLLMLPFVVGTMTALRLGLLHRMQFRLLAKTGKINQELAAEIDRRKALEQALKQMAETDPLTGLYNRRAYELLFEQEIGHARRHGTPLSVCIADLDHFKRINDTFGHTTGDEVLRRTAALLRGTLRATDIVGRLGGEEFIFLLPETGSEQADLICRTLLKKLSAADMGTDIRITATIGITELRPTDKELNALIRRADAALYTGKTAGRNRTEILAG